MNAIDTLAGSQQPIDSSTGILKLAILAVGGQGGGVLSNWVVDLAERGGYQAQVTSVAGVAQRTGATIYYVEMAPKSAKLPVFALSPSAGDVDVLIASELMEAGRAVQRGFVTPDRTTLIASSHRILAVTEKQVPGDGRGDSDEVHASLVAASKDLVCFDMEKVALANGSVISSSLFGGLARSGVLRFDQSLFEEVIKASGKAVEASLRAFRAAVDYDERTPATDATKPKLTVSGPEKLQSQWASLETRIAALPAPVHDMAAAGLQKIVDYQDPAYGAEYLDHLATVLEYDTAEKDYALTREAAKYIANAMCYDDIIRVADLKTRASRMTRVRSEQEIQTGQIVHVTEYFHPRVEEVVSVLPRSLGRWAAQSAVARTFIGWVAGGGKRIRTDRLRGFFLLYAAASLRPLRRRLLRHKTETDHLDNWLSTTLEHAANDYQLGVELLRTQRLIKGYSDTHARGLSKFAKVQAALPLLSERSDAADWIRRLRDAALQDEQGDALDGALMTIQSFSASQPDAAKS